MKDGCTTRNKSAADIRILQKEEEELLHHKIWCWKDNGSGDEQSLPGTRTWSKHENSKSARSVHKDKQKQMADSVIRFEQIESNLYSI